MRHFYIAGAGEGGSPFHFKSTPDFPLPLQPHPPRKCTYSQTAPDRHAVEIQPFKIYRLVTIRGIGGVGIELRKLAIRTPLGRGRGASHLALLRRTPGPPSPAPHRPGEAIFHSP